MKTIVISGDSIELYKLLKFEGLVATGGEAKAVIADGQVLVNGELETRKRKKLIAGDRVECCGQCFSIAGSE